MKAIILASGPSLTRADLDLAHDMNELTIAVNSTIFTAPWSDAVFAMDHSWWKHYHEDVKAIGCDMYTSSRNCLQYGPKLIKKNPIGKLTDGVTASNSGTQAAELAYIWGAREIILLGVDCVKGEKWHHHEDHPMPLGTPTRTDHWIEAWERLAATDARLINCSPICPAECFERMSLGEYLGER